MQLVVSNEVSLTNKTETYIVKSARQLYKGTTKRNIYSRESFKFKITSILH